MTEIERIDESNGRRYYVVGDRRLLSVTTIIANVLGDQYAGVNKFLLEKAAERGRRVHKAVHYLETCGLRRSSLGDIDRPYVEAYDRFKEEMGWEVESAERTVFSLKQGYAGTLDQVGRMTRARNAPRGTLDLKTTIVDSLFVGEQVAAYTMALREMTKDKDLDARWVLYLRPKNKTRPYKLKRLTNPLDYNVFSAATVVANRLQEVGWLKSEYDLEAE